MNHIYGPVPSRRLGLSLGIDIVPMKTCSLSCIYCQIGKTPQTTLVRQEYISVSEILNELMDYLKKDLKPDWITFSGSGEPTLNSGIGEMIKGIKALTDIPICVITNGTLLWDYSVRKDIIDADAVMPSLDSAKEETFRKICRPYPDMKIEKIINGLADFRKMYNGKIWLEILFVEGINDSPEELELLNKAIERISPDSIHLNTVVRPPADSSAKPLSVKRMEEIRDFFGDKAEIIAHFNRDSVISEKKVEIKEVREYLKRRPGSVDDISAALGVEKNQIEEILEKLNQSGEIRIKEFFGKRFWEFV